VAKQLLRKWKWRLAELKELANAGLALTERNAWDRFTELTEEIRPSFRLEHF
jgi:hypothetical protein